MGWSGSDCHCDGDVDDDMVPRGDGWPGHKRGGKRGGEAEGTEELVSGSLAGCARVCGGL